MNNIPEYCKKCEFQYIKGNDCIFKWIYKKRLDEMKNKSK